MDDIQHACALNGLMGTDVLVISTLKRETLEVKFGCFLELRMQFLSNYKSIGILIKTHSLHQKNIYRADFVANSE